MKTFLVALWLVSAGVLSAAGEQDWTAWQWEASFEVAEPGIVHLEVPPATLDVTKPDLGDLRILSPAGVEIGFLVHSPPRRPGNVRDAAGFKVTLADRSTTIEVSSPSADAIEAVQLVSPAREFLKSVGIEGRMDDGEWQTLATQEVIFRQSTNAERIGLPIPPGAWRNLRFTVNDDRSQPIPFTAVRLVTRGENL
jgi:hypothetical protein